MDRSAYHRFCLSDCGKLRSKLLKVMLLTQVSERFAFVPTTTFCMSSAPNPLASFLAIPDRDAYATIRGFVYQAALTVESWLRLSDSEMLELEAGEDIDWKVLAQKTISSREDVDRVLGQVKYRDSSITLRSPVSLECLVNFFLHRESNPHLRLGFRFLSNAKVTQERGHRHPTGLKGIELWASLSGDADAGEKKSRLSFLRQVLLAPSEPPSLDRKHLAAFRAFVRSSSDEKFMDFVCSFQWMKSSGDLESSFAAVEQAIRSRRELLHFEHAAPFCLRALLQHVLLVLSQSGQKELRAETCAFILRSSQRQVAEAVTHGLAAVREKLSVGASALTSQTQQLGDIVNRLAVHAAGLAASNSNVSSVLISSQIAPILEAPSLVHPCAPRTKLRKAITTELAAKGAVVLVGDVACGKSQLALVSAQGLDQVTWLSLRANEGIDPSALLDAAVVQCHKQAEGNGAITARAVVIDDLEIGLSSRKFCDRFALIARDLKRRGTLLVACSTKRLPTSLQQLSAVLIGGYVDEDIRTLLHIHGAPPDVNRGSIRDLISSVTGSHPVLVGALVQFLIQQNWQIDNAVVEGLLSRSFSQEILMEMQHRLLAETSVGAKELLYRVSLSIRPITQDQALTLGEDSAACSEPQ